MRTLKKTDKYGVATKLFITLDTYFNDFHVKRFCKICEVDFDKTHMELCPDLKIIRIKLRNDFSEKSNPLEAITDYLNASYLLEKERFLEEEEKKRREKSKADSMSAEKKTFIERQTAKYRLLIGITAELSRLLLYNAVSETSKEELLARGTEEEFGNGSAGCGCLIFPN